MGRDWTSIIILAIIVIALIWFIGRRGKRGTPKLQVMLGLISDVNDNIKLLETRRINPQSTKKFRGRSWKAYQDKLDFLDATTVNTLKETFNLVSDFNEQIELAKKSQTTATLQELPLDKLKQPLTKSKEVLVQWLRANLQTELGPTRRNTWGF